MTKKCTKCGEYKPLSEYQWAKKTQGLYQSSCKSCVSAYWKIYRQEHKDKLKQKQLAQTDKIRQRRIEQNPPVFELYKICPSCKQEKYYKEFGLRLNRSGNKSMRYVCKTCIYETRKKSDPLLLEKQREANRRRYKEDPERSRLNAKAWKVANPDKVAKHEKTYRAKRLERCAAQSDGTLTQSFVRGLFAKAKVCCYCGYEFQKSKEKSLDHIVPLSKGGLHSASNVDICCVLCNSRKSDKLPEEYASKQKTTI